jgi:outer membrane receptor protein involved in Fe transport
MPRRGSRERSHAQGNIGLVSSQLTLDGPLPGQRGSYLVSGRSTYLDVISDLAYRTNLIDFTVPYGFTDLFAHTEHDLGRQGAITWSGYLNGEAVGVPPRMMRALNGDIDFRWGSRMSALTVRHPLGSSVLAQARFGYSDFHGSFEGREWQPALSCAANCPRPIEPEDTSYYVLGHSLSRALSTEFDLTWVAGAHQLRAGAAWNGLYLRHQADFRNTDSDILKDMNLHQQASTLAAYLEEEWSVNDRLNLRAGARVFDAGRYGRAWLPRLGARLRLSDRWSISLGAGRYAQLLRGMRDDESVISSFIAYELFALQPDTVGLARADDLVLGLHWQGPRSSLRIDAYTRRMHNLVMPLPSLDPMETPPVIDDEYLLGSGAAHGLELMARHRQGDFDLGLNYAYTNTTRRVGSERFTPRFERRHTLDLTAGYTAGATALNARLTLAGGQPYTPALGVQQNWLFDGDSRIRALDYFLVLGEHNSARMPAYVRLDVSARRSMQKRWFGRATTVTPYIQILNVLNAKNVLLTDPAPSPFGKPVINYWPQFPILPTFGLEWKF